MQIRLPVVLASCLLGGSLMTGCAGTRSAVVTAYDLGSLQPAAAPAGLRTTAATAATGATGATIAPITVADVSSAPWLDSQSMFYRLSYENDQQPRPYAQSRWSMPPPQLLGQRLKARMAQAGNVVLSAADGALNVPLLRLEADDFSQRFSSPAASEVHVSVRASVLNGRLLVAQRSFEQSRPAQTADAAGGASALAIATDAVIGDMMAWLATLPAKK